MKVTLLGNIFESIWGPPIEENYHIHSSFRRAPAPCQRGRVFSPIVTSTGVRVHLSSMGYQPMIPSWTLNPKTLNPKLP